MPQDDTKLAIAIESLSKGIQSFHTDFKHSILYLINVMKPSHETEDEQNPTAQSQQDLFATQSLPTRQSGRAEFKFPSDEKESEESFETKVSQSISQVAADWKKLIKTYEQNYGKSLRNSGLSSKYKEFLERDPPFFCKKFCPTPTNPINAEIDTIRVEQQRVFVQKECQVMELHATNAQKTSRKQRPR